jgi:Ca2+-transporting ATPase
MQNRETTSSSVHYKFVRLKNQIYYSATLIAQPITTAYHSIIPQIELNKLATSSKKIVIACSKAGMAHYAGEKISAALGSSISEISNYRTFLTFLIGLSFLGYSSTKNITDSTNNDKVDSLYSSAEILSIIYLYTTTYSISQKIFENLIPNNYALIASLGMSTIIIPSGFAYAAKKIQHTLTTNARKLGAQRSDTSLISNGLSIISNTYFFFNYILLTEIITLSRIFQLALISHNIINALHFSQQFRNLPALFADLGPSMIKQFSVQREKIVSDRDYNTSAQSIMALTSKGPNFFSLARHKLRTNDLVILDEKIDHNNTPISGEIIALQPQQDGFSPDPIAKKINVNLKAHNGEDIWIELTTQNKPSETHFVDLHSIRAGKQTAVLRGCKINTFDAQDLFIKVKAEIESLNDSASEKKAIINDIINAYKKQNVIFSIILSLTTARLMSSDKLSFTTQSLQLMFNLYQILIPFSETFLRDRVNSKLISQLNQNLPIMPIKTIDALRIVDLCNTALGYYNHRFPKGIAIISDKTGTLTTSKMNALGFWTRDMAPDIEQSLISDTKSTYYTPQRHHELCFTIFSAAYTNQPKELEAEEHSIYNMFCDLLTPNCLTITTLGHNHLKKHIAYEDKVYTIETFHLGLFSKLGGRLTLVDGMGEKMLVYCGVPRPQTFRDTPLLTTYTSMKPRTSTLTRDWCLGYTKIANEHFIELKNLFYTEDRHNIFHLVNTHMLNSLNHTCTFLINNPVKMHADKFIGNFEMAHIPVILATGDTTQAAENIAKILNPATKNIISIKDAKSLAANTYTQPKTTIIFSGINPRHLDFLATLLAIEHPKRPTIFFAEMSTQDKGVLAQFLKKSGFFVVANGDGTNDIAMMQQAHMVITHLSEHGVYAPGIEPYSDLSDFQLRSLLNSEQSFYELFDLHQQSKFIELFLPLMNSQEKPSLGLLLKSSKLSFELMKSLDYPAQEMWQQHWSSMCFDLIWLWITYQEILKSTAERADTTSLDISNNPRRYMFTTLSVAITIALINYSAFGETTNFSTMILMLSFLPLVLKNIFTTNQNHSSETTELSLPTRLGISFGLFKSNTKEKNSPILSQHSSLALNTQ